MSAPSSSPNALLPAASGGTRGAGVRQVTRRPLAIAFVAVSLVLGVVMFTLWTRAEELPTAAASPAGLGDTLEPKPPKDLLAAASESAQVLPGPPTPTAPGGTLPTGSTPPSPEARAAAQADAAEERALATRLAAREAALSAGTTVIAGPNAGGGESQTARSDGGETAPRAASAPASSAERPDQRQAFLARVAANADPYLPTTRTPARSPGFEVKQGTVLPATLISGINSDLPGQLVAQLAENVWDTATGRTLLIPQGSRLIGSYDSAIAAGQERVLVAWTRIIYPDTSSLDLTRMPGADPGGYAGFHDRTNEHLWRNVKYALLLSGFSAGVQLSQPATPVGGTYTPGQVFAGSLGQQLGELGIESARRGMARPPTVEIRPGYRFVVHVTKDIILPPWEAAESTAAEERGGEG